MGTSLNPNPVAKSRCLGNFSAWLLASLLFCNCAQYAHADAPSRIQAGYDVLKGGIRIVTIIETYTRTKNNYRIESVSKASGLLALFKPEIISVTSLGMVTAQGLRPATFTHQRKLDSDRNARADLDWETKNITLTDYGGVRVLPLPLGTQDRLSAMYQFIFLELGNEADLNFFMTNGNKLDEYNYHIVPNQSVTVPLGTFKATYVASRSKPEETKTEIWLAAEHANFPYKMVITDSDGGKLTQVITQFNFEP